MPRELHVIPASARPGFGGAYAQDDPTSNSVGPMARRLILLLDQAAERGKPVSVAEAVAAMTAANGDPLTRPGVSRADLATWWESSIVRPKAAAGTVEDRKGTATKAKLCCMALEPTPPLPSVMAAGRISFKGESGEALSQGRSWTATRGITVERFSATEVALTVADPDGDWHLEFAASRGLRPGRYARAQRAGFEEGGRPGLALTGHSAGCNEVSGDFDILAWPTDGVGRLAIKFRHICDDIRPALVGDVDIVIPPH